MKYEDYIKDCKKYIAQFDNFVPAEGDGRQQAFKVLIDRYKVALSRLEEAKGKVVDACSLGVIDAKKQDKNNRYPPGMNAHHLRIASIIGTGVLLSMAGYVGFALGGPNLAAWSSTLPWIAAGVGAGFGLSVAAPIYAVNRKKFDRDKVRNRPHRFRLTRAFDREQRILERIEDTELDLAHLAAQVHSNMDSLLSGDFTMRELRTEQKPIKKLKFKGGIRLEPTGKMKTVEINGFKEEYDHLPRKVRNELDRALTDYNREYATLTMIGQDLSANLQEIKKLSKKKKTTTKKATPKPTEQDNQPTETLVPDAIIRADGTIVLGTDSYEIIDTIEAPVEEDTQSLPGTAPVHQLPPGSNSNNNNTGRK
jgi:hypothetical protein